jgi:hypothetical protein
LPLFVQALLLGNGPDAIFKKDKLDAFLARQTAKRTPLGSD